VQKNREGAGERRTHLRGVETSVGIENAGTQAAVGCVSANYNALLIAVGWRRRPIVAALSATALSTALTTLSALASLTTTWRMRTMRFQE
jgi:hypothetical protein